LRSTRSNLMDVRLRVQEAAMSPAFDEVRERLHEAATKVDDAAHRLETLMMRATERARRRTEAVGRRLSPARLSARVAAAKVRFKVLCAARDAAAAVRLEEMRGRLAVAAASLDALSPLAVLKRGYAIASDEGVALLRDARQVSAGAVLRLRLAAGRLQCRVEEVENN